eukprot:snap_masked-scaffold_2-processed-gene-25.31-mRNA-1 protein AED:1.00 eAED:1.00 QI:0/-1/0/0/-1/1/1/0/215
MEPENLKDWKRVITREKEKIPRHKSKHDPKKPLSYSTFSKNIPSEVSASQLPPPKPKVPLGKRIKKQTSENKNEKNFIKQNALSVIKTKPVAKKTIQRRFTLKDDYGVKPAYLESIKKQVQSEKQELKEILEREKLACEEAMNNNKSKGYILSEGEKKELLTGLKLKWAATNKRYQSILAAQTLIKLKLKEKLEKQLIQIEKDIDLLNHPQIKVL